MALTKDKKQAVVAEVTDLLNSSKMTVVAKYEGTGVKALQELRRDAKQAGTTVKVVKNRLVIQALKASDKLKNIETNNFQGMLLYAFNDQDEVAPAQSLNNFAKLNTNLQFIGAISAEGELLDAESVKALALLPGRDQLIAGLINTLNAPLQGALSGLGGNLHGLLKGLEAKAIN
jgi:large subunit ribosomal protein L10